MQLDDKFEIHVKETLIELNNSSSWKESQSFHNSISCDNERYRTRLFYWHGGL